MCGALRFISMDNSRKAYYTATIVKMFFYYLIMRSFIKNMYEKMNAKSVVHTVLRIM